jgi:predicted nucleic acid-binding protein
MRVVLDTNILVSALIAPAGKPAAIYSAWVEGKFTLLTCAAHLDELLATLEKPRVAELVKPYKAGRLVNQIKRLAEDASPKKRRFTTEAQRSRRRLLLPRLAVLQFVDP